MVNSDKKIAVKEPMAAERASKYWHYHAMLQKSGENIIYMIYDLCKIAKYGGKINCNCLLK